MNTRFLQEQVSFYWHFNYTQVDAIQVAKLLLFGTNLGVSQ